MINLDGKSASEITHLLKKLGKGSMKKTIKILLDAYEENMRIKKINNAKNVAIVALAITTVGLLMNKIKLNIKKGSNELSDSEIKYIQNTIEKISEEEADSLIEEAINETYDNDKEEN